jgi:exodeoxyribonuclease V alpha subunit
MSEATERPAETIHRLLEYDPFKQGFTKGPDDPLEGPALLIVDEFSMCDIELAHDLFSAIPADSGIQIVLVGDVDQLPSVGPGSALRDLIDSQTIPVTRLSYNYRQAGGSIISRNANLIVDEGSCPLASEGDWEYRVVPDAAAGAEEVMNILKAIADDMTIMDWQVLVPMRKGDCGVTKLNERIRDYINPSGGSNNEFAGYRIGDKVMVVRNDYRKGVFNGDIGIVVDIDVTKDDSPRDGDTVLIVDIDGRLVTFDDEDASKLLTQAYAITIHKSQGSEFPLVIMPLV